MPKKYQCNQQIGPSALCGETDPTRFYEGRYSTCKACRYKANKLSKEKKEANSIDDSQKKIEVKSLEETILDLDQINSSLVIEMGTLNERIEHLEIQIASLRK